MSLNNRMERFADSTDDARLHSGEDGSPDFLHIKEPAILARFVAFCKLPASRAHGARILFRGQTERHPRMVPSLFRTLPNAIDQLWEAYRDLLARFPKAVKGTRYRKANLGAVLQHYGLRTSWLDLVDNLYTATWFATHCRHEDPEGATRYRPSSRIYGWIVLLADRRDGYHANVVDIREDHSSLNVRCHAQHGFSMALQSDDSPGVDNVDLSPLVVATIRIPNDERWHLGGHMMAQSFLFPNRTVDNTYHQLLRSEVSALIESIEDQHSLPRRSLGRISEYVR